MQMAHQGNDITTHNNKHSKEIIKYGKKVPCDPGIPKRNMSSYLLYQNAMREPFK